MLKHVIIAALLTTASVVQAASSCAIPSNLTPAPAKAEEERRIIPVEKFALAWYWWPENCKAFPGEGCNQHFGFKLHGLWPDGAGETWPQYCRTPTALPVATVRANWCMTPAVSLLQHEWAKHGTCFWRDADSFFADERKLYEKYPMPEVDRLKGRLTAGDIRDAVMKSNPGVPREAIFVGTAKKQWLTEVRLCLNLSYRPVPCENNKIGAPDRVPVRVRPR